MRVLREGIQLEKQADSPPPDSHWREAAPMWRLQPGLHSARDDEAAYEDSQQDPAAAQWHCLRETAYPAYPAGRLSRVSVTILTH